MIEKYVLIARNNMDVVLEVRPSGRRVTRTLHRHMSPVGHAAEYPIETPDGVVVGMVGVLDDGFEYFYRYYLTGYTVVDHPDIRAAFGG